MPQTEYNITEFDLLCIDFAINPVYQMFSNVQKNCIIFKYMCNVTVCMVWQKWG